MNEKTAKETVTLPEVAKCADVMPDTLRMWYRRGYLEGGQTGWRRYSVREASEIVLYAEVLRLTDNHQIAKRSVEALAGYLSSERDGFPQEGLWLVFHREKRRSGALEGQVVLECQEIENEETKARYANELERGTTLGQPVATTTVPLSELWPFVAHRVAMIFGLSDPDGTT